MLESIDQQVLNLELKCRHRVDHVLSGHYQSVFKGRGLEFDEVRPYTHGDDVRFIDWNVTARTNQPFIKRFHEERELNVIFIVDRSASFQWSSRVRERRQQVAEFCALLGQVVLKNQDRVGFLLYSNEIESYLPPARSRHQYLMGLQQILEAPSSLRSNDMVNAIQFMAQLKLKRSVFFVLSDFQDESEWRELELLNLHHEVVAVRIYDPFEQRQPNLGLSSFKDIEKGNPLYLDVASKVSKRQFHEQSFKWLQHLNLSFVEMGISLISMSLEDDVVEHLLRFYRHRERLAANETGGI